MQKSYAHMLKISHLHLWDHAHLIPSIPEWIIKSAGFFSTCAQEKPSENDSRMEEISMYQHPLKNFNHNEYPVEKIIGPYPVENINRNQTLMAKIKNNHETLLEKINNNLYPAEKNIGNETPTKEINNKSQTLKEKSNRQYPLEIDRNQTLKRKSNNGDKTLIDQIDKAQYPFEKTNSFEHESYLGLDVCKEENLKQTLNSMAHFGRMDFEAYAELLHKCTKSKALAEGKLVHAHMVKTGSQPDLYVGIHLLNMYVKCGNLQDGHQVFDRMPTRNAVSWTAMIAGYVQHGCGREAIELFSQMVEGGEKANEFTFTCVLTACASVGDLDYGKQVHVHVIRSGVHLNLFVGNSVVTMYAKCGSIGDARQAFDEMSEMDIVLQNAVIAGYVQQGLHWEALEVFCQVQQVGIGVDEITFASVLAACASLLAAEQGKAIHSRIIKTRYNSDIFVGSALVNMYAKCGGIEDAYRVFEEMPERDIVLWNSMIAGFVLNERFVDAMEVLHQMQWERIKPDKYSFGSVLGACICPEYLNYGKQVWKHRQCSASA